MSVPALPGEPLFTVASLADHWGVSRDLVRDMIARGELRAVRIGSRRVRIRPADAERALKPANPAGVRLREAGGRVA